MRQGAKGLCIAPAAFFIAVASRVAVGRNRGAMYTFGEVAVRCGVACGLDASGCAALIGSSIRHVHITGALLPRAWPRIAVREGDERCEATGMSCEVCTVLTDDGR